MKRQGKDKDEECTTIYNQIADAKKELQERDLELYQTRKELDQRLQTNDGLKKTNSVL